MRRQRRIARDWVRFRAKHIFSQAKFAEALGISRRTVQYVETGKGARPGWACLPHTGTIAKFRALRARLEANLQ